MFKVILCSGYEDYLVRESELRNSYIKQGNSKCDIYYRGHGNYIWHLSHTALRNLSYLTASRSWSRRCSWRRGSRIV